ncbi:MAG TPA: hypothetical protein VFU46_01270 [Gemmatimonadales bacterium]|nr:hypothetical protein [Gemmatimonadales bacterium]
MLLRTLHPALLAVALGALAVPSLGQQAASPEPDRAPPGGPRPARSSAAAAGSYEARISGAITTTLRGAAEFGSADPAHGPTPVVIALGPYDEAGAIVLTSWAAEEPATGAYPIADQPSPGGVQALVLPGSPTRPVGAFRAQHGLLTITHASRDSLAGRFELHASGLPETDPTGLGRAVTVNGTFAARRAPGPRTASARR